MLPAGSRLYHRCHRRCCASARLAGAAWRAGATSTRRSGRASPRWSSRPEFRAGPGSAPEVLRAALRALGPVLRRRARRAAASRPGRRRGARSSARSRRRRASPPSASAPPRRPAARIRQCAVELNAAVRARAPPPARSSCRASSRPRCSRAWRAAAGPTTCGATSTLLLRGLPGNVTTRDGSRGGRPDRSGCARTPSSPRCCSTAPGPKPARRCHGRAGGRRLRDRARRASSRATASAAPARSTVARPRWRDDPSLLLRVIAGGLAAAEPGAHRRQHQAQVDAGEAAAARLVAAAGRGLRARSAAGWCARLARVARDRHGPARAPEVPASCSCSASCGPRCWRPARPLARRGQLAARGDVWHLGFDELAGALDDHGCDLRERVAPRAAELRARPGPAGRPSRSRATARPRRPSAERADLPAGRAARHRGLARRRRGIRARGDRPEREVLLRRRDPGGALHRPRLDAALRARGRRGDRGGRGDDPRRGGGARIRHSRGGQRASAVERIKTGQRIRVDGTRGFVQILEPA